MVSVQKKTNEYIINLEKPLLFKADVIRHNQVRYNFMLTEENSKYLDYLVNKGFERSRSGVLNRLIEEHKFNN